MKEATEIFMSIKNANVVAYYVIVNIRTRPIKAVTIQLRKIIPQII